MKTSIFINKIYSKKAIERIQNKIKYLGINSNIDINEYLTYKIILLVLLFITLLFTLDHGYLISPIITIISYYLYDYLLLDLKIKKRADILEHDAIFFFEVLSLTIQSEKNLKKCLEVTSNAIDSTLSDEVKYGINEVKVGKSLTEALENLNTRIPIKSVNNVILNLIESNIYGTPLKDALNSQIEYLTDKRILNIKGQINKIPTKISIVSVLIFIPLIMLLILGPIVISYFFK